jgi:hypothetical protein
MLRKPVFVAFLVVALVSLGCGISFNLPERDLKTGATQTEAISIPEPEGDAAKVTLSFAAGRLILAPGAQATLVEGMATYNVNDLKPKIETTGDQVEIRTGDLQISGIPRFGKDVENTWDLKLGTMPMDLRISAGAYEGDFELGGLSLRSLDVTDGAAQVDLNFSKPNAIEMETLRYETGASNVKLTGLANANFRKMTFRSGAGDYTLDFTGELQQDTALEVFSGVSKITIVVPDGMAAVVRFKGGLSNVNTSGGWEKSGDQYQMQGSGPALTIDVDMGAGSLELRNR